MKINDVYQLNEILGMGLSQHKPVDEFNAVIFLNENYVYFFERINDSEFRLYSVISKRSFCL